MSSFVFLPLLLFVLLVFLVSVVLLFRRRRRSRATPLPILSFQPNEIPVLLIWDPFDSSEFLTPQSAADEPSLNSQYFSVSSSTPPTISRSPTLSRPSSSRLRPGLSYLRFDSPSTVHSVEHRYGPEMLI